MRFPRQANHRKAGGTSAVGLRAYRRTRLVNDSWNRDRLHIEDDLSLFIRPRESDPQVVDEVLRVPHPLNHALFIVGNIMPFLSHLLQTATIVLEVEFDLVDSVKEFSGSDGSVVLRENDAERANNKPELWD